MRPVNRGQCPVEDDGSVRVYTSYGNARRDLIDRMGQYCSYCNQKLPASLAVEHVRPKSLNPELELEWDNFLLGCTNCNSTKGDKPVDLNDYVWPDVHNTSLAFTYSSDGKVHIKDQLEDNIRRRAQNLLNLVGLEKYEDKPTDSDRRWKNRKTTFHKAEEALKLFESAKDKGAEQEFTVLIGLWATDNGFFSIWIQVFSDYPNVKKEIINSFKGTATDAFDDNADAVQRTPDL